MLHACSVRAPPHPQIKKEKEKTSVQQDEKRKCIESGRKAAETRTSITEAFRYYCCPLMNLLAAPTHKRHPCSCPTRRPGRNAWSLGAAGRCALCRTPPRGTAPGAPRGDSREARCGNKQALGGMGLEKQPAGGGGQQKKQANTAKIEGKNTQFKCVFFIVFLCVFPFNFGFNFPFNSNAFFSLFPPPHAASHL